MKRTLFAVVLAFFAGILAFSTTASAGYPDGADQTWEPWYRSWTDSSWVSPDPVFRPGDTEDRAIGGEMIRRNLESPYAGVESRLMPRLELPEIGSGEIIWSIDLRVVSPLPDTVIMYYQIHTVDEYERPYHSPFYYPTEEWTTYTFNSVPQDDDDAVDSAVIFFISRWGEGGLNSYGFEFDDLKYSQDWGATWTVIESGGQPTAIEGDTPSSPVGSTSLSQNFPNPFNPSTSISYDLTSAGRAKLTVFDASGRIVRTLVDADQAPGTYTVRWDGTSGNGGPTPSGVYFYRLETASGSQSRLMLLMK